MSSLTELAEKILASAKALDNYAACRGLPPTHFVYNTLTDLPTDVERQRNSLIDASQDIKRLALGPVGMLLETLFTVRPTPRVRKWEETLT